LNVLQIAVVLRSLIPAKLKVFIAIESAAEANNTEANNTSLD
jgi:hypothetical protein